MKEISYVYQLSLRKASDKDKAFNIESDTIFSKRKFKQEDVDTMSDTVKADVFLLYLGVLTPPSKTKQLETKYYTKEDIEEKLKLWNEEENYGNDSESETPTS